MKKRRTKLEKILAKVPERKMVAPTTHLRADLTKVGVLTMLALALELLLYWKAKP